MNGGYRSEDFFLDNFVVLLKIVDKCCFEEESWSVDRLSAGDQAGMAGNSIHELGNAGALLFGDQGSEDC
ncbi:hypothetical protein QV65_30905 [Rhodococcus erythropolis]|nr:hypothetical protein QV65_30905 [Rhodococcus erythropolis]